MRIVIDTNIFRQDFLLKSRKFELLIDFISKTTHSIVLPQVIFDEIVALYKRELLNSIQNYYKAERNLRNKLFSSSRIPSQQYDIEREVASFTENFKKKLNFHKDSIIPHNDSHLSELVRRSINKIPPFKKSDKQFRDGLIWLSLFDVAEKFKTKSISFISNNIKDFCERENQLHSILMDECMQKQVEIQFYPTLDDFLKEHASKISYINKEWILNNIDFEKINDEFFDYINCYKEDKLIECAQKKDEYANDVELISIVSSSISTFFVYEMSDGTLIIETDFESELEIQYVVDDEYFYLYPIAEFQLHIIVEDKVVVDSEISECFIGN